MGQKDKGTAEADTSSVFAQRTKMSQKDKGTAEADKCFRPENKMSQKDKGTAEADPRSASGTGTSRLCKGEIIGSVPLDRSHHIFSLYPKTTIEISASFW